MQIEVSRRVNAPAERVWGVITDLSHSPEVITAIESVEILAGGDPFDVATKWRETRTMFGREATEVMEVVAVTPGRSYSVVAASHGARYESGFDVTPVGDAACQLRMTFSGEPTTSAGRLMAATVGRLFAGATRKAVEADLADIAAAAEGGRGATAAGSPDER